MRKKILTIAAAAAMATMMSVPTFAQGWQQNATGWWYQEDDGSYPTNTGKWIDDNGDGAYEFYYFDENGYLLTDTEVPGRPVPPESHFNARINKEGQLEIDGEVSIAYIEDDFARSTGIDENFADETYDENGISRIAMDMLLHSREENAKYGEIACEGNTVIYSNGFKVGYEQSISDDTQSAAHHIGTVDPKDGKKLLKFHYASNYPTDRVKDTEEKSVFVQELGFCVLMNNRNLSFDSIYYCLDYGDNILGVTWYCSDRVLLVIQSKAVLRKYM